MSNLYIGIDGGGTGTRACLMDQNKKILGTGSSTGSSIDTYPAEVTKKAIHEAVASAFKAAGKQPNIPVAAVVAGLGGIVSDADKKGVCDILATLSCVDKDTKYGAHNDMVIGEAGGNSGRDGMVLIQGTGAVAWGKWKNKAHKSGGWGWKEGDFGSAYALGCGALQMLCAAYDGREKITPFTEALFRHFKLNDIADITTVMYQNDLQRTDIAALAPFVVEHAEKGDQVAQKVANKCADDAFAMLKAVHTKIADSPDHEIECCLIGGLANADGYIKDALRNRLEKANLKVKLHPPELPAEVGAAYLAFQMVNK